MTDDSDASKIIYTDSITNKQIDDGDFSQKSNSRDIDYTIPFDNISNIRYSINLLNKLREANLIENVDDDIEVVFDTSILTYAEKCLKEVGLDLDSDDYPVDQGYIYALLLNDARGDNFPGLANHFDEYEEIREEIGDIGTSKSTFYSVEGKLEEEGLRDKIREASYSAFTAAYLSGLPIPDTVKENHKRNDIPLSPIALAEKVSEESSVTPPLRDEAIKDWATLFIENCLLPQFSFDRGENISYSIEEIIGLLAHCSLQSTSLTEGSKTCSGWIEDHDLVATGGGILSQIRSLSITRIWSMFMDINRNILEVAADYGFFDEPVRLAFDSTNELYFGDSEAVDDWLEGHSYSVKGDVDESQANKWKYCILSIIESDSRFALGVYPYSTNKQTSGDDVLERLLRGAVTEFPIDIEYVIMDRGFYGSPYVKACRNTIGDNWLIHGKDQNKLKDLRKELQTSGIVSKDRIDIFNKLSEKPNAGFYPISDNTSSSNKSHRVYITDLPLTETDIRELHDGYRERTRIETTIGQIKDRFMPETTSPSTRVRYFYFNLSMVFYNLYVISNNAISPNYGLDINDDMSAGEILSGLRHIAFEKAKEK